MPIIVKAAGADRHQQDEHFAMTSRRDIFLQTGFHGEDENHPLLKAIIFCHRAGLPVITLPCSRKWSTGYVQRVQRQADPFRAGVTVPVPDDRIDQANRLFEKYIRISAGAMDTEDLIDLDEELRDLAPPLEYAVYVRIGPDLLRKRPELRHLAGNDNRSLPSQIPEAAPAPAVDVMLVIAVPEPPPK